MIEELEIVKIEKIKTVSKKTKTMYDLETKKNHNFFANGILVHNSATARRDDGDDMKIWATTGYIIHKLSSKKLIDEGWLIKPQITFIKDYMTKEEVKNLEQDTKTGLINETPNYANYYNAFIKDNIRRNVIIKHIVDTNKDKKILILTKLIEHGDILKQMLKNSEHLYGATNKEDRKKMFEEFVNGDLRVLISTMSIFAEGIDVPALDLVINASANKGSVKTVQILGRVLRKLEGKENAQYIDFIDETKFFRLASLARKKILFKEKHNIDIKKIDDIFKP